MKSLLSVLALAFGALTFQSCEDYPNGASRGYYHGGSYSDRYAGDHYDNGYYGGGVVVSSGYSEHDHGYGGKAGAAETLQGAAENEDEHRGRKRAHERARHIDQERDAQRKTPSMNVGNLAVEGEFDRLLRCAGTHRGRRGDRRRRRSTRPLGRAR